LLTILREMEQQGLKVISLQDEGANGQTIPLAEIAPFTFLATFNRGVTDKNRRDNWAFLKTRWVLNAPVPDDFAGIPRLHNMTSRLFPSAGQREKDHVGLLWQVAALAVDDGFETLFEGSFNLCLKLKCVGIGNLTIGLFWINPEKFLPADHKTTAYGKSKGITTEPEDYESYRLWLKEMTTPTRATKSTSAPSTSTSLGSPFIRICWCWSNDAVTRTPPSRSLHTCERA
jgi:hypothetical protein